MEGRQVKHHTPHIRVDVPNLGVFLFSCNFFCGFCFCTFSSYISVKHIMVHIGKLGVQKVRLGCSSVLTKSEPVASHDNPLRGRICKMCNFVNLLRRIKHDLLDAICSEHVDLCIARTQTRCIGSD